MANKDFLSSLTEETKPESFKEEERVKIEKQSSPMLKYAIIAAIIAAILCLLIYIWIALIPHIKFEDFTNRKVEEVQAFISQNEIETQGIIFFEEYNFDIEKGYIISQSVAADKKIKKNQKITFYVSKGADPSESIVVPDLENMTKKQIENWISENKLQGTKISTAYSDDVEKDGIISIVFKNDDRSSFTRSSTLTITFSKGQQPATTVKIKDFKDQLYSVVETFAKENKLEIKKVETVSTSVEKGYVISTSPAANESLKQGETLTVYVSRGIAVTVPSLVGKTEDDLNIFKLGDGKTAVIYTKTVETNDASLDGIIKEQSIKAGTKITDEVLVITIYQYTKPTPNEYDTLYSKDLLGKTVTQANSYIATLNNNNVKVVEDTNYNFYVPGYKKGEIYYVDDTELRNNNNSLDKQMNIKVRVSAGKIYDVGTGTGTEFPDLASLLRYLSEEGFEITYTNGATYNDANTLKVVTNNIVNDQTVAVSADNTLTNETLTIYEGQQIEVIKN